MFSTAIMKCLLVVYFVICVACLFEKNWPKALYWFSAAMITTSVLWGMR